MKKGDEQYTPEEAARRRDEAIRRALNTPPTPHKTMIGKRGARPRPKRKSRSGKNGDRS